MWPRDCLQHPRNQKGLSLEPGLRIRKDEDEARKLKEEERGMSVDGRRQFKLDQEKESASNWTRN